MLFADSASPVTVGLGLVSGLVLFLFGLGRMSGALKAVAGERLKNTLARLTTNRFLGVLTGAVVTAVLDSSSAVTIMVIGLVSARLLSFEQALGVILGANIGTCVSSQIFAFNVMQYAPVVLLAGFLLRSLARGKDLRRWGTVVLGLGMVFFGLHLMDESMKPLADNEGFKAFLRTVERNRLLGVLAGAAFTALIQSSSATVAIVIGLVGQGQISLVGGVTLMLGAEVGTCADTLVATIGRSRDAVRAGVFQLAFNVASVALFVPLAPQLAQVAEWSTTWTASAEPGGEQESQAEEGGEKAATRRQMANAHILFNTLSVLIFVWFIPPMARGLRLLIPDKGSGDAEPPSA